MTTEFVHSVARPSGVDGPEAVARLRRAGLWLSLAGGPGIGWSSDEFPTIFAADSAPRMDGLTLSGEERLEATVRPSSPSPCTVSGGVVALRRFELRPGALEEFLSLSVGAWPVFEELYEARILGLFRSTGRPPEEECLLLVTWYASLAEWERSRQAVGARQGAAAEAGRRFQRRHELTRRTLVRTGIPL
ncbi:MAG TPA: hypothetical protein VFH45_06400 [Acidimicrobiales bacterium]|nr:hypothetical protein [Acidimicrobiales bacterium]